MELLSQSRLTTKPFHATATPRVYTEAARLGNDRNWLTPSKLTLRTQQLDPPAGIGYVSPPDKESASRIGGIGLPIGWEHDRFGQLLAQKWVVDRNKLAEYQWVNQTPSGFKEYALTHNLEAGRACPGNPHTIPTQKSKAKNPLVEKRALVR